MIDTITPEILWSHADTGVNYFHPRACRRADGSLFMTVQEITGSDVFHAVKFATSTDGGRRWTQPEPIPELGWKPYRFDTFEGVCDVVPDEAPGGEILAMGHNVFYQDDQLLDTYGTWNQDNVGFRERFCRHIVYTTRSPAGEWRSRKILDHEYFKDANLLTCGCSQKVWLENGDLLIPVAFGDWEEPARRVSSLLCGFDGTTLTVKAIGNVLRKDVQRGLLEPSLVRFNKECFLTMRAEDGRGYASHSADGLSWSPIQAWQWEDGEVLDMSSTQQHWLVHRGDLYLVYTRKHPSNVKAMRWRAPLFLARVDPEKMCLLRQTERIVLPLIGDGVHDGKVPLMGNFACVNIDDTESAVTVGENRHPHYNGNTLLARIR